MDRARARPARADIQQRQPIERLAMVGVKGLHGRGLAIIHVGDLSRPGNLGVHQIVSRWAKITLLVLKAHREKREVIGASADGAAIGLQPGSRWDPGRTHRPPGHFPALPAGHGPPQLRALRSLLPAEARVYPVGGIGAQDILPWMAAGAAGFGFGSKLFWPEYAPAGIERRALELVRAYTQACRELGRPQGYCGRLLE